MITPPQPRATPTHHHSSRPTSTLQPPQQTPDQTSTPCCEGESKGRIEFFDLAKGFCIIFVVLYHASNLTGIPLWINGFCKLFRMPLYFFLSGIFFKEYGGWLPFFVKKTNKLLIPFLFWYLIMSVGLSYVLFHGFSIPVSEKRCDYDFLSLLTSVWGENFLFAPIWFLLCLFEVNLCFYLVLLVAKMFSNHQDVLLAVLSFGLGLLGLALWYFGVDIPLFLDSSMTALPFFYFGYAIYRKTSLLTIDFKKGSLWLFVLVSCAVLCVAKWWTPEIFSLKYNHFSLRTAFLLYPCGIIGTLAVVFLAKIFNYIPLVSYWGRYSIVILVTHTPLLFLLERVLSPFSLSDGFHLFVLLVVTFLLYLLIIPFVKKFLPHVTAQKDIIKLNLV